MKSLPSIPNEMILASAGSGKTWQLTNRFIALMGRQLLAGQEVTPERIVAVTFTRKAAGEFFDSILKKLATAASSPAEAAKLAGDETVDPEAKDDPLRGVLRELKQAHYAALLEIFVQRMPRLFLGTLDSFFSLILRSFPSEFGLAGDFEILDEHLGETERQRVYRRVFQRSLGEVKSAQKSDVTAEQRAFLEAFRQATFGREESRIEVTLDQFIEGRHEILLQAAKEERWGQAEVIWPNGCPWLEEAGDLGERIGRLIELLEAGGMSDKQRLYWDQLLTETATHVPGAKFPTRIEWFFKKLLPAWNEVLAGEIELIVNRQKQRIRGEACQVLQRIFTQLVGAELKVRLERTRGVWAVLSRYEDTWSHQVRRRGRLTFQDMQLILAGHEFGGGLPAPMLSQVADEEARLRIDYRLDARYDHWLLDEFQDTNQFQWKVIENLIDEVVQDTSDERSLFQVGDVKQAIYAWRGGDTRLFDEIHARYSAGREERIRKRPLNVSWRSGHDVIDMVNRVFGDEAALESLELPTEAVERWPWQEHTVAGVHEGLDGQSMLLQPMAAEGEKVTAEDRFNLVVGLLEEIDPVERGIRCAILVQSNKNGHALLNHIRARSNIPVMSEADIAVATDNALTLAVLSLFKVAAHPGDTMAWQHLQMTPFAEVLGDASPAAFAAGLLRKVFDEGFEATLWTKLRALKESGWAPDKFSLRRFEDLALAARLFDESGSRSVDEFLEYARSYTTREPDTRNAVQVMTIHKSKGLTFDCVILPDVEGSSLASVRRNLGVKRDEHRQVEWVLDLPSKEIVLGDEVLSSYRADCEAEAAYENLCKFYVALTRARQANYVIAQPRATTARSNNFVKLLEAALADEADPDTTTFGGREARVLYASETPSTNARWFENHERSTEGSEDERISAGVEDPGRRRPLRRTPSGSESSVVSARQLFSRGGRFARSFGTLVHALFEEIDWLDTMSEDRLASAWANVPCPDDSLRKRAVDEVRGALAAPAVRESLGKPSPDATCWREKRFEILLNGEWLSGTFDRVVIESDRATILDFKTDAPESEEALEARVDGYRPQLQTYRQVLSRMTGLPEKVIGCQLLFTRLKRVIDVE